MVTMEGKDMAPTIICNVMESGVAGENLLMQMYGQCTGGQNRRSIDIR
jgi:hypothetical protein